MGFCIAAATLSGEVGCDDELGRVGGDRWDCCGKEGWLGLMSHTRHPRSRAPFLGGFPSFMLILFKSHESTVIVELGFEKDFQ